MRSSNKNKLAIESTVYVVRRDLHQRGDQWMFAVCSVTGIWCGEYFLEVLSLFIKNISGYQQVIIGLKQMI